MPPSHLALRGLLVLRAGLPLASLAGEPLIVVEDRGGASALPYYEALNLQPRANAPARPPIPTPQGPATPAGGAARLAVRSAQEKASLKEDLQDANDQVESLAEDKRTLVNEKEALRKQARRQRLTPQAGRIPAP